MDNKRFEIISMMERRRQWPREEKLRIMEEALAPGATVAGVAARNGVCRSQVYSWLRFARDGRLPGISVTPRSGASFVPVRIEEPVPPPPLIAPGSPSPPRRRASIVEIALANGRIVKVDEGIDPAALARLVTALDGGMR
jgi:transposase